ncbi:MAG: ABC transporter permease [Oscillospiraceae bacterium]|jgi:ABC-2 type transport system permease protein|nr:ABC transporter permease [Oscillospiraceae bacterium]
MLKDIKGWRDVFSFTAIQTVTSKSFIISGALLVALFTAFALSFNLIIPGYIRDQQAKEGADLKVQQGYTAYVSYDGTNNKLIDKAIESTGGTVRSSLLSSTDEDTRMQQIRTGTDTLEIVIEEEKGDYTVTVYRPEDESVISKKFVDHLNDLIRDAIKDTLLVDNGVAPENLNKVKPAVWTYQTIAGDKTNSEITQMLGMVVPMVVTLVLFMFIFLFATFVAQSIAQEKSSRVMELLLTSVRPLAVIIGKVLAMGTVALVEMVVMFAIPALAAGLTAPVGILGELNGTVTPETAEIAAIAAEIQPMLDTITPLNILATVVIFILGFLFYALLAGLVGATVSRIEDLQQAMLPFSCSGLVGMYLAYIPAAFTSISDGADKITKFARLFPLSSPFALPSGIFLGQMSAVNIIVAILVLAVCVIGMAFLTSKVYEYLILHTGDRVKFMSLFGIAKNNKAEAR